MGSSTVTCDPIASVLRLGATLDLPSTVQRAVCVGRAFQLALYCLSCCRVGLGHTNLCVRPWAVPPSAAQAGRLPADSAVRPLFRIRIYTLFINGFISYETEKSGVIVQTVWCVSSLPAVLSTVTVPGYGKTAWPVGTRKLGMAYGRYLGT